MQATSGVEQAVSSVEQVCRDVWRKAAPFLYDLHAVVGLHAPSISIDYLPTSGDNIDRLALGSFGSDDRYLYVLEMHMPEESSEPATKGYRAGRMLDYGSCFRSKVALEVPVCSDITVITHPHAEACNLSWLAVQTASGNIHLYNLNQNTQKLDTTLSGEGRGNALSWRQNIVAGFDNGELRAWTVRNETIEKGAASPDFSTCLGSPIQEVCWSPNKSESMCVFASIGDDCKLKIWDLKSASVQKNKPVQMCANVHEGQGLSVAFEPGDNTHMIVTTGADGIVRVWDRRWMQLAVRELKGHSGPVFKVQFAPFSNAVFATASKEQINIWDLSFISKSSLGGSGLEQNSRPAEEHTFLHRGPSPGILNVAWSTSCDWTLASPIYERDRASVEIWQPSQHVYLLDSEIDKCSIFQFKKRIGDEQL
eukprot:Platyproteum_vivax@DN4552_c0_g1_i2.p1